MLLAIVNEAVPISHIKLHAYILLPKLQRMCNSIEVPCTVGMQNIHFSIVCNLFIFCLLFPFRKLRRNKEKPSDGNPESSGKLKSHVCVPC